VLLLHVRQVSDGFIVGAGRREPVLGQVDHAVQGDVLGNDQVLHRHSFRSRRAVLVAALPVGARPP